MHKFWIISIVNMAYTRLQNYTNMMVGEHGIQAFKVVAIVLLFLLLPIDNFVLISAHSLLFIGKWFVLDIYLNVRYEETLPTPIHYVVQVSNDDLKEEEDIDYTHCITNFMTMKTL